MNIIANIAYYGLIIIVVLFFGSVMIYLYGEVKQINGG
jgi:hypothetical protein